MQLLPNQRLSPLHFRAPTQAVAALRCTSALTAPAILAAEQPPGRITQLPMTCSFCPQSLQMEHIPFLSNSKTVPEMCRCLTVPQSCLIHPHQQLSPPLLAVHTTERKA